MPADIDEMAHMEGWTVQQGNRPPEPEPEAPQKFVTEQLPAEEGGLEVPEGQVTDDASVLDPMDQVRLTAPERVAHQGIIPTDDEREAPPAAAEAPAEEAAEEINFDAMTKAEIQGYADENGIDGVDMDSQTKAEMIAAVGG